MRELEPKGQNDESFPPPGPPEPITEAPPPGPPEPITEAPPPGPPEIITKGL